MTHCAISFTEAAILLVSDGDRDLWPGPTPEVRDPRTSRHSVHAQSQVWQIWLVLVSIYCASQPLKSKRSLGLARGPDISSAWQKGPLGTRFYTALHLSLNTTMLWERLRWPNTVFKCLCLIRHYFKNIYALPHVFAWVKGLFSHFGQGVWLRCVKRCRLKTRLKKWFL